MGENIQDDGEDAIDVANESAPRRLRGERIAKVMARAGLCSRRDAEAWIRAGRVQVNGATLESPAFTVLPSMEVLVDGEPLPRAEAPRLWRFYKPKGFITTHKDPKGRPTIFDVLPSTLPRLVTVGRLDRETDGLLLLTNDGELARYLEMPSTALPRVYSVKVDGRLDKNIFLRHLRQLEQGVTIQDVKYGPIEVVVIGQEKKETWLIVGLTEGKNRELRRVFEYLGWPVKTLRRISYGPFRLENLRPGQGQEIPPDVMREIFG